MSQYYPLGVTDNNFDQLAFGITKQCASCGEELYDEEELCDECNNLAMIELGTLIECRMCGRYTEDTTTQFCEDCHDDMSNERRNEE